MVDMCEFQPDLIAAGSAELYSFHLNQERDMMERLWNDGHLGWLSRQLVHSSVRDEALDGEVKWDSKKLAATQAISLHMVALLCPESLDRQSAMQILDQASIWHNLQVFVE